MKNFIKVTKGGEAHVILAANRRFYESQGWKVEEPSIEEMLKAYPDYADVIAREAEQEAEAETETETETEAEAEQEAETETETETEAETGTEAQANDAEAPAEKTKRAYRRKSN